MPGVLVETYSPDHGASVPAWRNTRNSSGDRRTRHSSSVLGSPPLSAAMVTRYGLTLRPEGGSSTAADTGRRGHRWHSVAEWRVDVARQTPSRSRSPGIGYG